MDNVRGNLRILLLVAGLFFTAAAERTTAQHEHHSHNEQMPAEKTDQLENPETISTGDPASNLQRRVKREEMMPSIGLAELEQLALANNPTLKQAELSIRAAEGRKIQAGLFPNPIVGLSAENLSFRNFGEGGKIGFFIEQKIPLGGKLAKSRRVFEQDINLAEVRGKAQRRSVLNSVRMLYAEALGAQQAADLKKEMAKLAEESVEVAGELYNVGLADKPDQLKTEINQKRAEAEYFEALNKYEEIWQKIGAMVGAPDMQPARLSGNLTDFLGEVDSEELLADLLKESPEIKAAEVNVERARLALRRARAEIVPDLYLRGGVGYNSELIEKSPVRRRSGVEGFIEVGVRLPIFNRNQGGIRTAEAELAITEREVERLRLALRTRFAEVLRNYRTTVFLADRYRTEIVPKAKAAYEMYSVNFQNMTAAYTNVLTTRAAYLQAQIDYARNLTEAQKSFVLLKGFLLNGGLNSPFGAENDAKPRVFAESPVNEEENRE